jgi:hypothetical protein
MRPVRKRAAPMIIVIGKRIGKIKKKREIPESKRESAAT